MSDTPKVSMDHLKQLKPMTFLDDPAVKMKIIETATKVGQPDPEEFYEQQANYLKRILVDKDELKECTVFSLYAGMIDVALDGLSLDPNANLCYFQPRNVNVGTRDVKVWEKRAIRKISPYGELALRVEMNQIKYADNVIIVYEGDEFRIRCNESGNKVIIWEADIPRKPGTKIIGSFIKLTRPDNSWDFFYMLEEDIERLKKYSERDNRSSNAANALYTSVGGNIDSGFLAAKTIKHAFKTFPKMKIKGISSELDNDGREVEAANSVDEDSQQLANQAAPPVQTQQNATVRPQEGQDAGNWQAEGNGGKANDLGKLAPALAF